MARNRYQQSFQSSIFSPPDEHGNGIRIPAGKRRDQTVGEMFGYSAEPRNLRSEDVHFEPKRDPRSARDKKIEFLGSSVLGAENLTYPSNDRTDMMTDNDGKIDHSAEPIVRRHMELHSDLFGRETPNEASCHDKRLTPTDFRWYNCPTNVPTENHETHKMRSYMQKSSKLFDRTTPQPDLDLLDAEKREEQVVSQEMEHMRKSNTYYSDLFGRQTPMSVDKIAANLPSHPRPSTSAESQITVNQQWTDSRTELLKKPGFGNESSTAGERKRAELDQSNIFEDDKERHAQPLTSLKTDNSHKVHRGSEMSNLSDVHQAHLRSSLMDESFYNDNAKVSTWEVADLHLSGLSIDADEASVRKQCQRATHGGQIVKVMVDMDPVSNRCKGNAKIVVRYHDPPCIEGLISTLRDNKVTVHV